MWGGQYWPPPRFYAALPARSPIAIPSTPARRPASTIVPIVPVPGTLIRARTRRTNRLRQRFHLRGNHHHLTDWPFADTLAAYIRLIAQRQMQNPPLAAVHRAEVERNPGLLHPLRSGFCAHS